LTYHFFVKTVSVYVGIKFLDDHSCYLMLRTTKNVNDFQTHSMN